MMRAVTQTRRLGIRWFLQADIKSSELKNRPLSYIFNSKLLNIYAGYNLIHLLNRAYHLHMRYPDLVKRFTAHFET